MMSEDSGEQQQIAEDVSEESAESFHEKMITLYNSTNSLENAIGYWMKVGFELFVAAGGLVVFILLPGFLSVYFGIAPVGYLEITGLWATVTVTVFTATWCFSEPMIEDDESETADQD
jgi:hypothetical protein